MKFNINILLFFLLIVVLPATTSAQNISQKKEITKDYNQSKLQDIQKKLEKSERKKKKTIAKYALKNNIDIIIKKPEGGVSILQEVLDNGSLVYVTTYNEGAAKTLNTHQLYSGNELNLNLSGAGIEMGMWDGLKARTTHQELQNRINYVDEPEDLDRHPTHVAGTLLATGLFSEAKGMAFEATLQAYDFNNNLSEIAAASQAGMLLSNHSYGFAPGNLDVKVFGAYVSQSSTVDSIVYEAPHHLMVFAAGNSNNQDFNEEKNGYDLITGYNLSKNVLTVANVLQVDNYTDASSVVINNSSSWGPTDDGRIKPDISAKGTATLSSTSISDNAYQQLSGTSMAAPSITGSIALLQQHYNNLNGSFLKASTAKALAIHTAREAGDAPGPDYKFGWGLMDTAEAANLITNDGFTNIIEENTLTNNSTYAFTVDAIDPSQPLVATIVWTDPAGETQDLSEADDRTPRLVNDLDLRITKLQGEEEEVFFPWKLDVEKPSLAATQEDNSVDNVEKIEIPNAEGEYTIEVSHKGTLKNQQQDYSLVVSGIAVSNLNISSPVFSEIFCNNEAVATYDINLDVQENFTEEVNFSTSGLPDGLTPSFSNPSLTGEGSTTLNIEELDAVEPGIYNFTVTATSGAETSTLNLELEILNTEPIEDIVLLSPLDDEDYINLKPELSWMSNSKAIEYEVQLATDESFNTIIVDDTTIGTALKVNVQLNENQTYYWRVRGVNDCSTSEYSTSSFTSAPIECFPLETATDTPVDIKNESTQTSIITFPEAYEELSIQNIKIHVEIEHTYLEDLSISLISPSGTELLLVNRLCGDGENLDLIFDDNGATLSCDEDNTTTVLSGTVRPEFGSLSELIGENPAGDWTLEVVDFHEEDDGQINKFGIEFCYKKVINDDICDALPLLVDAESTGDAFSLVGATAQEDEPKINTEENITGSVWFSFEAPSTGSVNISTDLEGGTLSDSKLAVYTVEDCSDFSSFTQIANDNAGNTVVQSETLAGLSLHNLIEGETYFIQVDRGANVAPGTFGIEVKTENLSSTSFEDTDFSIFPNPTKTGVFTIQARALTGSFTEVKLFNKLGQQVYSEKKQVAPNGEIEVFADYLSSGLYIVQLTQDDRRFNSKLIIE
jgi:subtilisin-like proprotein convertase family protein